MFDLKQSLPQIIAAIIGSSLIATALSAVNSFFIKPIIEISISPVYNENQPVIFNIAIKNVGYQAATHLRLIMSFPRSNAFNVIHMGENMTLVKYANGMVAFLPRLATGAGISIDMNISGISENEFFDNFNNDPVNNYNRDKYSITATYDQGTNTYSPPSSYLFLNIPILQGLTLFVLAFLSFVIPLRHKKKSQSRFVSEIICL
jgi:hypothetical protein